MEKFNRKEHWEKIYKTKEFEDVSWYQEKPATSLDFLKKFNIPKSAKIIDIGGGDSYFVDYLLKLEYEDITIVDISELAIERAKNRLGNKADKVNWLIADASNFNPKNKYDFWHDRAAFHFLTKDVEIENYINTVQTNLSEQGILVIGTFSEEGPRKCSGIEIQQYSETSMTERLNKYFKKIKCLKVDHKTPSDAIQNFIFCSFKRLTLN